MKGKLVNRSPLIFTAGYGPQLYTNVSASTVTTATAGISAPGEAGTEPGSSGNDR
jgi:hypothetical protein